MSQYDDLLEQLHIAQEAINNAIEIVQNAPEPEAGIPVKKGDDLMQMVADNPEGSVFSIATDFVQDVNGWTIPKACQLTSEGGTLNGDITCADDVMLKGLVFNGGGQTLITTAHNTQIVDCVLNGNVNGQHRGICVNSEGVRISGTRILNIFKDIDTQAIGGWEGTKDLVVSDCYLEASGENVIFGGTDSSSEEAMPCDIVIEKCHMTKKMEWQADGRAVCKNLLELKSVRNFIMRDCLLENSFVDGQTGFGIVLTTRNQDGNSPWSIIENVSIEDCTIRNVAGGVQILGQDYTHPSQMMNNVRFCNVKFENIDQATYGSNGRCLQISGGSKSLTLMNTSFQGVNINSAMTFDDPQKLHEDLAIENCEFIEGEYGIKSDQGIGTPVLEAYAPGYHWVANKVHKSGYREIPWPEGTEFV